MFDRRWPYASPRLLAWLTTATILALVLFGCLLLTGLFFLNFIDYFMSGNTLRLVFALFILMIDIGLWRKTEWARKILTVFIVAISIILPLIIITPEAPSDGDPILILAIKVYTPILVALPYAYFLGQYKFRKALL